MDNEIMENLNFIINLFKEICKIITDYFHDNLERRKFKFLKAIKINYVIFYS